MPTKSARSSTRAAQIASAAAVALLTVGCWSDDTASYTPTAPDAGRLHVVQLIVGTTAYVEGALSYIRIEADDGEKLIEDTLPNVERPTFTARLDPGTYEIVSWRRACDGDCGRLGEPTDECASRVRIEASANVNAMVRVSPGAGCTIDVEA